jgi:hypothetical protein
MTRIATIAVMMLAAVTAIAEPIDKRDIHISGGDTIYARGKVCEF